MDIYRSYSPLYATPKPIQNEEIPNLKLHLVKHKSKKLLIDSSKWVKNDKKEINKTAYFAKFIDVEDNCLFSTGSSSRLNISKLEKKSFFTINNIENEEFRNKLLKNLEGIEMNRNSARKVLTQPPLKSNSLLAKSTTIITNDDSVDPLINAFSKNTPKRQDTQENEPILQGESTEGAENTENTENVENTENTENTENVENTDNTEYTKNIENTQNAENTQKKLKKTIIKVSKKSLNKEPEKSLIKESEESLNKELEKSLNKETEKSLNIEPEKNNNKESEKNLKKESEQIQKKTPKVLIEKKNIINNKNQGVHKQMNIKSLPKIEPPKKIHQELPLNPKPNSISIEKSESDAASDTSHISRESEFENIQKNYYQSYDLHVDVSNNIFSRYQSEKGKIPLLFGKERAKSLKKLNILGKKSSLFIRKPTEKFQRNNTDTKNDSYVSVQLPTKEHAVWSPINQTTINFQEKFEIKKKPLHRVSIENNVYSKLRKINSNKILIRSLLIS